MASCNLFFSEIDQIYIPYVVWSGIASMCQAISTLAPEAEAEDDEDLDSYF